MKLTNLKTVALIAALLVLGTTPKAHAQQAYPLTCQGWGDTTSNDRLIRSQWNQNIGHGLLIGFSASPRRMSLDRLPAGTCSWPDRGMRGAELESFLYTVVPAEVDVIAEIYGNNRISAGVLPSPDDRDTNRAVNLFNRFQVFSQSSTTYTVCVSADVIEDLTLREGPDRSMPVLRVSKIEEGQTASCN